MKDSRTNYAGMRWAFRKSTGSLVLFVQGNPARAALKLTNPALHDSKLHYAKAVLRKRGVPCLT